MSVVEGQFPDPVNMSLKVFSSSSGGLLMAMSVTLCFFFPSQEFPQLSFR